MEETKEQVREQMRKIIENKKSLKLIRHPQRTLIIGKSRSGKTTLAVAFLSTMYMDLFDEFYLFSSTHEDQETYCDIIDRIPPENIFERATDKNIARMVIDHKEKGKPKTLVIIDDQSGEEGIHRNSKGVFPTLIFNSRWRNMSIIAMTHRVTAISPAFRDNCEHLILLNVGTRNQVNLVEKEFNPFRYRFQFLKLYNEQIANREFGSIHFDLRPPVSIYCQCELKKSEDGSRGRRQSGASCPAGRCAWRSHSRGRSGGSSHP
jgi:hypothetical protein